MTVQKRHDELAWRVGGPQGSGVDTAAGIFQRACALGGLNVYGRREYYSNIMGRHSYYDVRVSSRPLSSHLDTIDLLTTFEDESLARHAIAVIEGGAIVYSEDDADTPLDDVTYLDQRFVEEMTEFLGERDLPASTAGLLDLAKGRGIQTYAVNFDAIIDALAERLDVARALAARTKNTLAVSISCALVEYDVEYVHDALAKVWPGRDKIVDLNVEAANLAYEWVADEYDTAELDFRLKPTGMTEPRILVNGNESTAMGKIAGGMSFQTYYPISPATDESVYLEAHETFPDVDGEETGVVVVQTEDEISAVTMAAGAALTGARSATATSGPGFSLMAEGVGWAGNNEVPLVLTLYQRGSPSTGMPTRTEQGDLSFVVNAGHGEFPRLVVASGDIIEAFYDAAEAFNYAERYQTVVIHVLDKALASTTQTVPPFDLEQVRIERGEVATPDGQDGDQGTFPRFQPTASGVSPRPLMGTPGGTHWLTGGEHTPEGRVTEDPGIREQQMEKRMRKLELVAREIPTDHKFRVYGDRDADLTILSWGSNKGGILEAIERLEAEDIPARLVQVRLIWPFPEELADILEGADPLVAVEANFSGQYTRLLRQETGIVPDRLVVKYNGRPMSGRELHAAFHQILDDETEDHKIVLRNPWE